MPDDFGFVEEKPDFGFVAEKSDDFGFQKDTPETTAKRIDSDIFYNPTLEEFRTYKDTKAKEPSQPWEAFKRGVSGAAKSVGELATGLATSGYQGRGFGDAVQSIVEASGRGMVDLAITFRPLVDRIQRLNADKGEKEFLNERFAETFPEKVKPRQLKGLQQLEASMVEPKGVPADVRAKWDQEFKDYKLGRDYERFKTLRELQQVRETARQGKGDIVDRTFGTPNQQIAEGGAMFADPASVATMGAAGALSKAAAGVTRAGVSQGLKTGGAVAKGVGGAAAWVGSGPERLAAAGVRAATGSPMLGELTRKAVSGVGQISGTGLVGAKGAGGIVKGAGQVAQAAGRVAEAPSRLGALARIAEDGAAPDWLRNAASRAVILDPVIKQATGFTADVARGAGAGAVAGAGVGAATQGTIEGAAAGAGGGAVLGAVAGAAPSSASRVRRTAAERTADVADFLTRRSPGEVEAISKMGLEEGQVLRLLDIERIAGGSSRARARIEGGVEFKFLTPAEFKKAHPTAPRGAIPYTDGRVHINTGHKGSIVREVRNAVEQLKLSQEQKKRLNRLFQ